MVFGCNIWRGLFLVYLMVMFTLVFQTFAECQTPLIRRPQRYLLFFSAWVCLLSSRLVSVSFFVDTDLQLFSGSLSLYVRVSFLKRILGRMTLNSKIVPIHPHVQEFNAAMRWLQRFIGCGRWSCLTLFYAAERAPIILMRDIRYEYIPFPHIRARPCVLSKRLWCKESCHLLHESCATDELNNHWRKFNRSWKAVDCGAPSANVSVPDLLIKVWRTGEDAADAGETKRP